MNLRRIALISFLACLLGGFVCAQGARPALGQPGDLVELDLSPDIAAWEINVPNDGIALRVTGPRGFVYQATYASGDPVFFDFVDESGAPLADGVYNWEVVVTPSGALRAKREEGAARQQIPAYSGTFRIEGGLAVSPDLNEQGLRPRDIVHLDDVIATFSLCVGTDCVNGENFGFDTIRLKENNLRIKFQDTSNSASFPTQDWQLTANDSANGGANKFSIDAISPVANTPFTIEAGAPSHSLYVDDGGRIGAGTSTPVVELHVVDGDTPTLRLEQNGSSGFTPQTWDVAGNETNFFVRDATNGSTLPFKIRPTAASNVLVIDADSNIAMGGGTSTGNLANGTDAGVHLKRSNGTANILIEETSGTAQQRDLLELENNGGIIIHFIDNSIGREWDFRAGGTNFVIDSNLSTGHTDFQLATSGGTNASVLTIGGTIEVLGGGGATLPDYVFEEDYALMPLDELAQFVQVNKHLPNVINQKELSAAGKLNMNEMQMRLLEKVEELTLYTLGQEEKLKSLQQEKSELEQRLAKLEAALSEQQ